MMLKMKASLAIFKLALFSHRGFTLVEVLIALLVLGILFVPVSNAFLQSVHLNQHLQQRVAAVREAQTAMEVTLSLLNQASYDDTALLIEDTALLIEDTELLVEDTETHIDLTDTIVTLLAGTDTFDLINANTTVGIVPLNEDSPFFVITATSQETIDSDDSFITLTTLHLPGKAPWLTPKEYRVVTP